MGRACSACTHPESFAINEALIVEGQPNRRIATRYDLSEAAIRRHREHIPQLLVEASQAAAIADADELLAKVEDLRRRAMRILERAEQAGELRTALSAIAQARGNLELLARLLGELNEQQTTVNVALLEHPQWRELRAVIYRALSPYPEARMAMLRAIAGVEEGANGRALH